MGLSVDMIEALYTLALRLWAADKGILLYIAVHQASSENRAIFV